MGIINGLTRHAVRSMDHGGGQGKPADMEDIGEPESVWMDGMLQSDRQTGR